MEHNYNIEVSSDEYRIIYRFLSQDLSYADDYTRQYIDNKTLYYGYDYNREIEYNGKTYLVNLRLCDNQQGRLVRCLRILDNEVYHYIDLNSHKDIEAMILKLVPRDIKPRKLDDYNIDFILKNKRYSDLDSLDDNPYFVKEYYHNDWLYHAEYESIRLQLIEYLEKNKDKLSSDEIKTLDYYINKFKSNDKVIYERQFNFYFNEKDNSTLEKVYVKR
jgi:hypothetical protein